MQSKWVLTKVLVSQLSLVFVNASQCGSFEVSTVPSGTLIMKKPCISPVIPSFTVPPGGFSGWHAPGLGPFGVRSGSSTGAGVTKLPSLNCSTIDDTEPPEPGNTVKCRSNVSVAQSFPQVPESGEVLG